MNKNICLRYKFNSSEQTSKFTKLHDQTGYLIRIRSKSPINLLTGANRFYIYIRVGTYLTIYE